MTAPSATWASHYELIEFEVYAGTGNTLPSASITTPTPNANFTSGSSVTIAADASDPDPGGWVTKVEFYEGSNKLGEDETAPYSFTWNSPGAGTYSITAKAIDDQFASGISQPISITISNPPAASGWSLSGNNGVDAANNFLGTKNVAALIVKTSDQERMRILPNGKILVKSSSSPDEEADFAVNGVVYARKLKVTQNNWSDYVFDSTYKLRSLKEVEAYILEHRHLPDVPSANDVEANGLNVGEQHAVLLRKVEELTLYVIQQQKEIERLKNIRHKKRSRHRGKDRK